MPSGRCARHQPAQRQYERRHFSSAPGVNYGRRWQKARAAHLATHPYCIACQADGVTRLATELDHIIPHEGNRERFWDQTNWAGLCKSHHSAKTAREVMSRWA